MANTLLLQTKEIQSILEWLNENGLISLSKGIALTDNGTATLAENKPSALQNPYVLENEAVANGEEYHYIGQYACYYRLDVFKKKSLNEVLDLLEGYNSKVSPYSLEEEQVQTWTDTYKVLQTAFKELPKCYNNLYVVFE